MSRLEFEKPPFPEQPELKVEGKSLGTPERITTIPAQIEGVEGFWRFPEKTEYPPYLIEAVRTIIDGYTETFAQIVEMRQGKDGYVYAKDKSGHFVNFGFQVDIAPLPEALLCNGTISSFENLVRALGYRIFEIENSLAMYNLMRGVFAKDTACYSSENFFGVNFDAALERWRNYHGKPIVLGAVTEEKYRAMLMSEFGVSPHDIEETAKSGLHPKIVKQLSGFDAFFGPEQLQTLAKRGKIDNYILYMRTSYPPSWQRNPQKAQVSIPVLESNEIRKEIKRQAITFNVDSAWEVDFLIKNMGNFDMAYDPKWGFFFRIGDGEYHPGIINDTKEALVRMGLAFPITRYEDLCLQKNGTRVLSEEFRDFLEQRRYIPEHQEVRAKPLWLHYGGYGHVRGDPFSQDFRHELRRGLRKRGPYFAQPEIPVSYLLNQSDGKLYAVIHRLFFAFDPFVQEFRFIGGLLNALPAESQEVRQGRIHGNKETVWGEIIVRNPNLVVTEESLNFI